MSINVTQAWDGVDLSLEQGSGSNSSSYATVYYIVEGTQDDAEACTQAYNTAPEEFAGIPKKSVAISERLTDTAWKIEIHYGTEQVSSSGGGDGGDENDEATMNFDCSSGTTSHLHAATAALHSTSRKPCLLVPP